MSRINEQNLIGTSFQDGDIIYTVNKHYYIKNNIQLHHINLGNNRTGTLSYSKKEAIKNFNSETWSNIIKIGASGKDNYEMY